MQYPKTSEGTEHCPVTLDFRSKEQNSNEHQSHWTLECSYASAGAGLADTNLRSFGGSDTWVSNEFRSTSNFEECKFSCDFTGGFQDEIPHCLCWKFCDA